MIFITLYKEKYTFILQDHHKKNTHYISFCNVCLSKHKKGRHIHTDMTASM